MVADMQIYLKQLSNGDFATLLNRDDHGPRTITLPWAVMLAMNVKVILTPPYIFISLVDINTKYTGMRQNGFNIHGKVMWMPSLQPMVVRDLWQHRDLGNFSGNFSATLSSSPWRHCHSDRKW